MADEIINIGLEDIAEVLAMTPKRGNGFIRTDLVSNLNEQLKAKFAIGDTEADSVIKMMEANGYIATGNEGIALLAGEEIEVYFIQQKGKDLIKQYAKVK